MSVVATFLGPACPLERALQRWPGLALYSCDKCGHTAASLTGTPPPEGTQHEGCGGLVTAVPRSLS